MIVNGNSSTPPASQITSAVYACIQRSRNRQMLRASTSGFGSRAGDEHVVGAAIRTMERSWRPSRCRNVCLGSRIRTLVSGRLREVKHYFLDKDGVHAGEAVNQLYDRRLQATACSRRWSRDMSNQVPNSVSPTAGTSFRNTVVYHPGTKQGEECGLERRRGERRLAPSPRTVSSAADVLRHALRDYPSVLRSRDHGVTQSL